MKKILLLLLLAPLTAFGQLDFTYSTNLFYALTGTTNIYIGTNGTDTAGDSYHYWVTKINHGFNLISQNQASITAIQAAVASGTIAYGYGPVITNLLSVCTNNAIAVTNWMRFDGTNLQYLASGTNGTATNFLYDVRSNTIALYGNGVNVTSIPFARSFIVTSNLTFTAAVAGDGSTNWTVGGLTTASLNTLLALASFPVGLTNAFLTAVPAAVVQTNSTSVIVQTITAGNSVTISATTNGGAVNVTLNAVIPAQLFTNNTTPFLVLTNTSTNTFAQIGSVTNTAFFESTNNTGGPSTGATNAPIVALSAFDVAKNRYNASLIVSNLTATGNESVSGNESVASGSQFNGSGAGITNLPALTETNSTANPYSINVNYTAAAIGRVYATMLTTNAAQWWITNITSGTVSVFQSGGKFTNQVTMNLDVRSGDVFTVTNISVTGSMFLQTTRFVGLLP